MTQNRFAFFANFAETIRATVPTEKQAQAYQAICEFGIYGTLPDDPILKMMCLMAKTSIYNKGGAPEGNQNAKKQPQKQPENNLKQPENNPISETETEIETETETRNKKLKQETETETETEILSADAPKTTEYVFEGDVIRLKQKDFKQWQKAYPDLNLRAELLQRDIWLKEQPPEEQKKWFLTTSQYFIKRNEIRKAQNAEISEQFSDVTKPKNENECWF